jgi:arylformamidase
MIVHVSHKESNYRADLNAPFEIGIMVERSNGVSCFSIANANYQVYNDKGFIGSIEQGAGCNLETITFTPHGNSTHTECLGHIATKPYFVNECIKDEFMVGLVHSFKDKPHKNGLVVDFDTFDFDALRNYAALIIRTLPNDEFKKHFDYSDQVTPYISLEDMEKIVATGIKHLILDLPSVDPEWDNGALAAHHIFWQYPANPRLDASITEFAYIPNTVVDGAYLMKLNIANFVSDAAPSRPLIYPLELI